MKKLALTLAGICLAASASASVTLTFDTDLQGFVPSGFGNATNTSVTWSSDNGGSMLISNNRLTNKFSWVTKYFTNSGQSGAQLAIYNELVAARLNGGTISYDVTIPLNAVTVGAGTPPSFAQVNFFADNQNGVFDQEYNVPGVPVPVIAATTVTYTLNIQTAGGTYNNDDDQAYFLNSNPNGNLQFGLGSNFDNADGFSYYVDNFKVSAVPEPACAALLGLAGLLLVRRKRS